MHNAPNLGPAPKGGAPGTLSCREAPFPSLRKPPFLLVYNSLFLSSLPRVILVFFPKGREGEDPESALSRWERRCSAERECRPRARPPGRHSGGRPRDATRRRRHRSRVAPETAVNPTLLAVLPDAGQNRDTGHAHALRGKRKKERKRQNKRPKKENMNKAVTLCGLLATHAPELLVGQGGRRPQGDGYNGHVPLSCQGERAKRGGETRRPVDGIGGTVGLPAGRRLLEFFLTTPRDSKSDHTP
ncbi:hypothetical protein ISCGN_016467 [Ixodes scapularis]